MIACEPICERRSEIGKIRLRIGVCENLLRSGLAAEGAVDAAAAQRAKTARLRAAVAPVRMFFAAWQPLAREPEREAAERIRSDLEAIAQRQLGLVTDNVITPAPEKFSFQGVAARVQRVALRASGKDLPALLAWLGKVEERYPLAIIESCEFSSNVGGSTALTVRLVEPVADATAPRPIHPLLPPDVTGMPAAIAAVDWSQYRPARLKGALPIGFGRNPLRQVVVGGQARA